ncbi:glucose 1-dehydrogenase [Agrococcus sp. ARC_14]|uniref:SDR family NAD(P)-dependent oxidoreductase n=1 Tax=Agrococcus sp. ARC_14 TaxID=2919927 RepID=UPI001F05072F|nr:glucose 1-dehydrogenase [Agrococcus sp. ARC_14]MCH1881941.1 glucose 1-dehydrogenase [Agrococcus sp. ARC_14]
MTDTTGDTRRVALVTGGTSGLGAAIAVRLQADGLRVAVTGRNAPPPEVAASLGDALFVPGDLTEPGAPDRIVGAVMDAFGRLDVLVNNAGRRHAGLIVDTPPEELAEVFALNTIAAMTMTAAAARAMIPRREGGIINMLSRLASSGVPTLSAYSASKGALAAHTRSAAVELAPHNIRVNAVAPGMARTPLIEDWLGDQADPEQALADTLGGIPLGRLATPDDVAAAVSYLASPEAAYVTGASIAVDGGYTAR